MIRYLMLSLVVTGMVVVPTIRAAHAGNCTTRCTVFGNTETCNTYCY